MLEDTRHMARINEWTDEEVARLHKLYGSNRTFEEIELEFPLRTSNAIRLKASRLGIRRPLIPRNFIQAKPLILKTGNHDGSDGFILKCNQCGSWIQVDKDIERRASILNCGQCGSMYQVLMEL
jgi:hypothetical protein